MPKKRQKNVFQERNKYDLEYGKYEPAKLIKDKIYISKTHMVLIPLYSKNTNSLKSYRLYISRISLRCVSFGKLNPIILLFFGLKNLRKL